MNNDPVEPPQLDKTQRKILEALCQGATTREIAKSLDVELHDDAALDPAEQVAADVRAVKGLIEELCELLGARNLTELIKRAVRLGVIERPAMRAGLSAPELKVLVRVSEGDTDIGAARVLPGLTVEQVTSTVRRLQGKLKARNRMHLLFLAQAVYSIELNEDEEFALASLAKGRRRREVTARLGIARPGPFFDALFRKIGVPNGAAAVAWFSRRRDRTHAPAPARRPTLGERERLYAEAAAQRLTVAETAKKYGVTTSTVVGGLSRARKKAGLSSNEQWPEWFAKESEQSAEGG